MSERLPESLAADYEGGFTQVPNFLAEALLAARLNSSQRVIIDLILRLTYGWNREEVAISVSDFKIIFDSSRSWVYDQLKDLLQKKILIKTGSLDNNKSVWKVNPHTSDWDPDFLDLQQLKRINRFQSRLLVRQQSLWKDDLEDINRSVTKGGFPEETAKISVEVLLENGTGVLRDSGTGVLRDSGTGVLRDNGTGVLRDNGTGVVRDNGTPDPLSASMDPQLQEPLNTISNTSINTVLNTSKKKSKYIYPENSVYYSLAKLLRDRILLNRPDLNDPNLQNWSVTIDRMIKYDKRDPEMIKKVIIFAQEDEFWNGNILCAKSLRKQFDRLDIQRLKKEKREQDYRKEVKKYHGNDNDDEYDFFFQRKA